MVDDTAGPESAAAGPAAGVLLIPAEGDLELLREGPGGARPPTAWRHTGGPGWFSSHRDAMAWWLEHMDTMVDPDLRALALALDGEPVCEGLDRASRACGFAPSRTPHLWMDDFLAPERRHRADLAMWDGFGTLVLVDADGREAPR